MDRQLQVKILQQSNNSLTRLQGRYAFGAKVGLYGGAILLALVELMKVKNAFQKDQYIISGLYFANGVITVLTTYAFLNSTRVLLLRYGYWGLILIGVSIVISYGIDALKKREIRNFLEASAWGVETKKWSITAEKIEFEKIYE
jgi:hypothetical protein